MVSRHKHLITLSIVIGCLLPLYYLTFRFVRFEYGIVKGDPIYGHFVLLGFRFPCTGQQYDLAEKFFRPVKIAEEWRRGKEAIQGTLTDYYADPRRIMMLTDKGKKVEFSTRLGSDEFTKVGFKKGDRIKVVARQLQPGDFGKFFYYADSVEKTD